MIPNPFQSKFNADTRGQLLLLAAVAIVIIILGMVTLLNTAAFTQLERADGVTDYDSDALGVLDNTETSVETSIRHANHELDDDRISDNQDRITRITAEIERLDDRLSNRFGGSGKQVTLSTPDEEEYTEGIRIWQYPHDELVVTETDEGPTPPGEPPAELPDGNYGMFDNADSVRAFTVGVTGENLFNPGEDEGTIEDDAFAIDFERDDGVADSVYIYENPDESTEIIIESEETGEQCETIAVPSDPAEISFTHGTVDGTHCEALPGTEHITAVTIANGDNVEAALDMVADVDEEDINYLDETDFQDEVRDSPTEDHEDPEAHHAIYSVTVDVSVHTAQADYETTIRIAPQLPGDAVAGDQE